MIDSKTEETEKNLKRVIDLCYEMLELADHGDLFRTDSGCGIIYGILRDDAYKIRRIAEQEIKIHGKQNKPAEKT
ncbi:MAG: hypothetical protein HQ517_02630 [SAR324 cluster bacterium]|nr:hypothetical protein [SAR324 cluster bacterium]